MADERNRHVQMYALWVADQSRYADYRTHMIPILTQYGGMFTLDLEVGRLLKPPAEGDVNRLFAISFPDATANERFFADPAYLDVRRQYFEPAVTRVVKFGRLEKLS